LIERLNSGAHHGKAFAQFSGCFAARVWMRARQGTAKVFAKVFNMSSRLERILDWDDRSRAARYGVERLARNAGVCRRQLNRYFQKRFGVPVHRRLAQWRMREARRLIQSGMLIKEVAYQLGYTHATDLAFAFKRTYHFSPHETRGASPSCQRGGGEQRQMSQIPR